MKPFGASGPMINVIHDQALVQEFIDGIGKNILILTPSFPYVFIGKLVDVIEDHAIVDVKVTTISELEDRQWHVHIHQIEAFYIQRKGQPRIPELKDDY
ncbi:hypothetical protein AWH56_021265 [Anaerobacillus isosaccharinicus]|uniref:DUF2642 domain-containing protein n=1 Tax=Anaerobacillus isosaccharinicus TaxID=1532552 RepID=A0A1S2M2V7_9BACI|nr:hypothetical protein [Anaerobacillus isosaccharinicus]MBA5586560.1 hypothetical protein [Anaerobacillus isosaccharinicus]QOY35204.1 hypothetical protein AWH56_021265 [Anaerobacillus isosaccharinicus]